MTRRVARKSGIGDRLIYVFLLLAASYWLIQSGTQAFIFHEGPFLEQVLDTDSYELSMRLVSVSFLVGLGVVCHLFMREHNRVQDELRASEREKATVLDSLLELVTYQDRDLKIAWANRAAVEAAGPEAQPLVGRHCYEAWQQRREPCPGCPVKRAIDTGEPHDGEITTPTPDGRIWFVRGYPVRDEQGNVRGAVELTLEITERKRQQRQDTQEQKLQSIGQLAAGIAHEINTPTQYVGDNTRFLQDAFGGLTGVLGKYAELLRAHKEGSITPEVVADVEAAAKKADLDYLNEEIPKAFEESLQGIERVSEIVKSMKAFAHPDSGEKTPTDINDSIESTITVSRNEWKYVADMVTDFDPDLPLVPCLPGEFNQVVLNMIVNAAHGIAGVVGDGSNGKGKITVSTRRNGDWAEIRISDTGTGIPEEHRAKIFDPFFTTKEVGKGTGQGLAIAYDVIAEKHGGTISFDTEDGRGTTFVVRLPIGASMAPEEVTDSTD